MLVSLTRVTTKLTRDTTTLTRVTMTLTRVTTTLTRVTTTLPRGTTTLIRVTMTLTRVTTGGYNVSSYLLILFYQGVSSSLLRDSGGERAEKAVPGSRSTSPLHERTFPVCHCSRPAPFTT